VAAATFEAVALFEIMDRASPTLRLLSEQMERLDALTTRVAEKFEALGRLGVSGLTRSLDAAIRRVEVLNRELGRTGRLGAEAGAGAVGLGTAVGFGAGAGGAAAVGLGATSAAATAERAESMLPAGILGMGNVELRRRVEAAVAAAEARIAASAGVASEVVGRAASHGRFAHARMGIPIGPTHITFWPPMTAVAAAAGVGFATYEAAREQQEIMKAIMASGVSPLSPQGLGLQTQLAAAVRQVSSTGMIYSQATISRLLPTIMGLGLLPPQQLMPLIPTVSRFAEVAQLYGLAEAPEAAQAVMREAHLAGAFTPRQLQPLTDQFLALMMRSGTDPETLEKSLTYAMPMGMRMGISAPDMANFAVLMNILGVDRSKAGRAVSELLPGFMGPSILAATGVAQMAYKLGIRDIGGSRTAVQLQAQQQLGFVGPGGESRILTPGASIEQILERVIGGMAQFQAAHGHLALMQTLSLLPEGTMWRRYGSLLMQPGVLQRLRDLELSERGTTVAGAQAALQNTLIQQVQQFGANLANIFNDLGQNNINPLTNILKSINSGLIKLDAYLTSHPAAAKAASIGMDALVVGGALTLAGKGLSFMGLPRLGAAVRPMALGAAAIPELLTGAAVLGAALFTPDSMLPAGAVHARAKALQGVEGWIRSQLSIDMSTQKKGLEHQGGGLQPGGALNFGDIHIHGDVVDPSGKADQIVNEINRKLKDGITHNIGAGSGVLSSPWTSGLGTVY
jgi:hypothetical protein